jgi:membrane-anchored glycerophosphoryl diester phosphodiesterase (GDPDase)
VSTKVIAERYLGRRVRVANAVLNAVKLSPALLLALMASGLLTFFGYMLLIIPGIFVSLKLILVYPALVVERRGGISSMERSWKLTRGSIVKLMILYLVSLYPAFICGGLLFLFLGQGVGMDVAVQVLSGVMTAFLTVMLTVTYFERRCEKEAFDMQLLAQSFED